MIDPDPEPVIGTVVEPPPTPVAPPTPIVAPRSSAPVVVDIYAAYTTELTSRIVEQLKARVASPYLKRITIASIDHPQYRDMLRREVRRYRDHEFTMQYNVEGDKTELFLVARTKENFTKPDEPPPFPLGHVYNALLLSIHQQVGDELERIRVGKPVVGIDRSVEDWFPQALREVLAQYETDEFRIEDVEVADKIRLTIMRRV